MTLCRHCRSPLLNRAGHTQVKVAGQLVTAHFAYYVFSAAVSALVQHLESRDPSLSAMLSAECGFQVRVVRNVASGLNDSFTIIVLGEIAADTMQLIDNYIATLTRVRECTT